MPQRWVTHWPLPDGTDAQENELWATSWAMSPEDNSRIGSITKRERLKQTLGNLTLLTQPLNSSVSNGPFLAKRDAIAEHTLLELNRLILKASTWDEESIVKRGLEMATIAKDIWPYPATVRQA